MSALVTRKQAIERGEKRYFTGKPCKNGHLSERQVNGNGCIKCMRERSKEYWERNPEKLKRKLKCWKDRNKEKVSEYNKKAHKNWYSNPDNKKKKAEYGRARRKSAPDYERKRQKRWRDENLEAAKEGERQRYLRNRDSRLESTRRWRQANVEYRREYERLYRLENPEKIMRHVYIRRLNRMQASPDWADHLLIRSIYKRAQEKTKTTGIAHHVDHIYPLQGGNVCGLHVPGNLRIVTAEENLSKGNKFPELEGVC